MTTEQREAYVTINWRLLPDADVTALRVAVESLASEQWVHGEFNHMHRRLDAVERRLGEEES